MTVRDIVLWPDPCLSTVCRPVARVDAGAKRLARDMLETMYAASGRGLAAPQVGETLRLFVMDTEWKEAVPKPMVFINPDIDGIGDVRAALDEGCLSIPGITVKVHRPTEVTLTWTDLDGLQQRQLFTGFAAACVQHEMDHLDGLVTFDHLSSEARARSEATYAETAL